MTGGLVDTNDEPTAPDRPHRTVRHGRAGRPVGRPSMQDVADRAGVSRATVSAVLNDDVSARIAAPTRALVLAVADELGYRRNLIARSLRRRRTDTIGLVSDEVLTTPQGWALIAGAQAAAWERGRMLLLTDVTGRPGGTAEAFDALLDRQVDGLVLGTSHHRSVAVPADVPVPVVLLNAYGLEGRHPAVVPDDEQGGFEATRVLLEAGHERVGLVNERRPIPAAALREAGYRRALADRGLPVDPTLVCATDDTVTLRGGHEATARLLDAGAAPTALFCFNDRVAAGAYGALRERGLRVPDDVSVVGFDDQEAIVSALDPPLTTVRLPYDHMGRWAVERLLDVAEAVAPLEPDLYRAPCRVVRRGSVTPR